ncbi:MAG: MmgE/PrpD family protein [Deltaproteobacteria bacterium]|nr:MmgE/PrpD family protein [Deltaproteobacteria bacterium]
MTVLEQVGAYVARGGRESPSAHVRRALRLHVADTVGAWIAGCSTAEGRMLVGLGSPPRESRAPRLTRDGTLDEVMTNCALARLSEIDDIHLSSGTTPGALVIPAALTIGGSLALDRAAITEAILVGYEAMVRLGAALNGPSILYRGIWPTYFTAPFGVAATAARLLGLTARQAAQALGVALIMASPGVGCQSGATLSRWLAVGYAARTGVSAALSAQAGFTADLNLLEGDFFPSIYGLTPDLTTLTDGLGESSILLDVSFKPWCAARQTMAATQALREIIEIGVSAADMTEIVVSVPEPYVGMINHGIAPGDRMSHLTSVSYQMALSVFAPGAVFDVNQTPAEVSEEIRAFMSKVTVRADDSLLQYYPRAWPARLVVCARSGRHERLLTHVPGDPERPFDERQVVAKFRRVVAPVVGERAAEDLAGRSLAALEEDGAPASLLAEVERARAAATGRAKAGRNREG